MFRRQLAFLFLLKLLVACGHHPSRHPSDFSGSASSIDPSQIFFLSPEGKDSADGSRTSPWKTWERALSQSQARKIVLLEGRYPPATIEPKQALIISSEGRIQGDLEISRARVWLRDFELNGHLRIIKDTDVKSSGLQVKCSTKDCVFVQNSRLAGAKLVILGAKDVQRNLLIESSTVSLSKLRISGGGNYAQVLGRARSRIQFTSLELEKSRGIGISCSSESLVRIRDARITKARKYNLLASDARLEVETSTLGSTQNVSIGLQGAQMNLRKSVLQGSTFGLISLIRKGDQASAILIEDSVVQHGSQYGIMVAGGQAVIRDSLFQGASNHPKLGDDSILVTGPYSSVDIERTEIVNSNGFGLALYDGAFGKMNVSISSPSLGGILIHSETSEKIEILQSSILGAKLVSGITALAGDSIDIEDVDVRQCKAGGILVGQKAAVRVVNSRIEQNGNYQLSAYGHGDVQAIDLELDRDSGETFASCAESAQIEFIRTSSIGSKTSNQRTTFFCP